MIVAFTFSYKSFAFGDGSDRIIFCYGCNIDFELQRNPYRFRALPALWNYLKKLASTGVNFKAGKCPGYAKC